jgi:hypothetical protein
MKLGIMQPYFFPYIGYFALINYVDKWIVLDNVQYIYHGWINRNRILNPIKNTWQYITVPINRHSRNTFIKDITIHNTVNWKDRIIRQLEHYKKIAPFYNDIIALIKVCFANDHQLISELNVSILEKVCSFLGINRVIEVFSQMKLDIELANEPGDWAFNISKKLNAREYINPIRGIEIFDKKKFEENGIKLKFLEMHDIIYNQKNQSFISDLSIIDLLMFNDIETIHKFLNNFDIFE